MLRPPTGAVNPYKVRLETAHPLPDALRPSSREPAVARHTRRYGALASVAAEVALLYGAVLVHLFEFDALFLVRFEGKQENSTFMKSEFCGLLDLVAVDGEEPAFFLAVNEHPVLIVGSLPFPS